jgi:exosortase E/protease (VPEID-CTERM system)
LTPAVRFTAAIGVALIEILALTVRFDTGSLAHSTVWWATILLQGSVLLRLGITVAVAALLFCGAAARDELRAMRPLPSIGYRRLAYLLLGHVLAVACVYQLTEMLLEHAVAAERGSIFFVAWLTCGAAAAVTLGLAVLPAKIWAALARANWPSLLAASAVGAVAWGGGLVSGRLWAPLGQSTLWLVGAVLHPLTGELVYSPAEGVVGTGTFAVEIAPQCSGYEGIGLILAFLGGYLWFFRHTLRFPSSILLLPLGVAAVWIANALRIVTLILIGTWGSRDVALGGFHSQAGWLSFNAIALGLALAAHRSRLFAAPAARQRNSLPHRPSLAPAYLIPLLVLAGIVMFTTALSADFDVLYPARVVGVGLVLWHFRRSYPRLRWSWRAFGIGLAAFAIWLPLALPPVQRPMPATIAGWSAMGAASWIVFRVLGSCLVVPLAEELAFRGYLTRRLIGSRIEEVPLGKFTWLSFVLSSALFGAMHGQWLAGTLAGLLYALALYRRRDLSDAIVAHATTNAAIAAYVLASGDWGLWL